MVDLERIRPVRHLQYSSCLVLDSEVSFSALIDTVGLQEGITKAIPLIDLLEQVE